LLSTNLHRTILTNASKAIRNCVDEVLRAFYNEDLSNSTGSELFYNESKVQCDDLLLQSRVSNSGKKSQQISQSEGSSVIVKDGITSSREMIKEMIYFYMEISFPPFPVFKIEDPSIEECLSTRDVFAALVEHLSKQQLATDLPLLPYVDDFLSRELVKKIDISNSDDGYEPMSLLVTIFIHELLLVLPFCFINN